MVSLKQGALAARIAASRPCLRAFLSAFWSYRTACLACKRAFRASLDSGFGAACRAAYLSSWVMESQPGGLVYAAPSSASGRPVSVVSGIFREVKLFCLRDDSMNEHSGATLGVELGTGGFWQRWRSLSWLCLCRLCLKV